MRGSLLAQIRDRNIILLGIMQTDTCVNCGASIDHTGKFCRRCGQPLDPSELTTRTLEEPPRYEAPTRFTNSGITSPTYAPPGAMPPQAPLTSGLEPSGQKKTIIVLAVLVAILLVALASLAVFTIIKNSRDSSPATTVAPPAPPPVLPGIAPPAPPSAPPAPGIVDTTIGKEMIYPGAEVTMEINGEKNERVVHLRTTDEFDKVVDWYMERIKVKNRVRLPGSNAVLEGKDAVVVINSAGSETSIIVTQKANQ